MKQINENLEQNSAFPAMQPPADIPVSGPPGASAYELAVAQGFAGTMQEWFDSLQGAQGARGGVGADGAQGAQGEAGLTGDQGAQGDVGGDGPEGARGPQGPQGEPGPEGPTGPAGPPGDTGSQGMPGDRGATGETGPRGDQGMAGPSGAQGDKGARGDTGLPGAAGLPGDRGPAGDPGPQGDRGATGATGAKGDKGDTGSTGPAGAKGDTGAAGQAGVQGIPGGTGPAGAQGLPGVNAFATPASRTVAVGTAYQATDKTKPAILLLNLSAQSSAALLSLVQASQKGEIVIAETAAGVTNGTGQKVGLYENTTGGALVVGLTMTNVIVQGYTIALPAGWYFGVNRTAGTNLAVTSCFDFKVG